MRLIRQPLARRTVLRGVGTALSLPLLEAMIPAASAAEIAARPKRFQVFYTPNGLTMASYVPAATGPGFALPPSLAPLEPMRGRVSVLSGLAHLNARPLGDPGGNHGFACATYLTGVHPKPTEGFDLRAGTSVDQLMAQRLGNVTPFASLELGLEAGSAAGSCDVGFSCAYTNGLSWRTPTVPLPLTVNPRDLFERLFGDGDTIDPKARMLQLRRQTSLLDFVMDDAKRLSGQLGASDLHKIDEYMEATRDVERRIQKAIASAGTSDTPTDLTRPAGIPDSFEDHARLMIDLQVLALQADMTRVTTFMLGREISNRAYPEIGVPDSHHMLSHHGNDPVKMAKLALINRHHIGQLAYYLKRMAETKDGEGSLLDSTLVLAGPSFGDSNAHEYLNFPAILAGGPIKGGQHFALPKLTRMSDLLLAALNWMGASDTSFGDSTGPLAEFALA